jgi:DNA helicase-4
MCIEPYHLTSPAAFFDFAGDNPDCWEKIRGKKVIHCDNGVGLVTNIISVTYNAGRETSCGGIFVAFESSADQRPDRFDLEAFADGTFTGFVLETADLLHRIRSALRRLELAEASDLHDRYTTQLQESSFDYDTEAQPYLVLQNLLREHNFAQADAFFTAHVAMLDSHGYERVKVACLMDYFRKRGKETDVHKGIALSKLGRDVLVTARAGSGKTRLLMQLVSLLADRYDVPPHAILVLAFNRKAAQEIGQRIAADLRLPAFANARTFHSLAYQLVQPGSKILCDASDEPFAEDLSSCVRDVLRNIWNPAFQAQMYTLFRSELQEMDRTGTLLNDSDYLVFRRNLPHVTLAGEYVKSAGEKIIADFLFEHGVAYKYEPPVYWGRSVYRPDFVTFGGTQDIILEHWALDPDDPHARLPASWSLGAAEYKKQICEKRAFWQSRGTVLVETSANEVLAGRDAFERQLGSRLREVGIPCERLPQEEMERKVVRIHRARIMRLFVQFIQKCKKRRWTAEDAAANANDYSPRDDRERAFIGLAIRVYAEYEKTLVREGLLDFDVLMESAIEVLNKSQGQCSVRLGQYEIPMRDFRWVLIDEYQDFSPQFFALLQALRQHNPGISLFCVGDDWQAINRFAGSDLSFFHGFDGHFQNGEAAVLPTNYRSRKAIVEAGNFVMQGRGAPAEWLPDKESGEIHRWNIDEVWIECRPGEQHDKGREADRKFRFLRTIEDGREVSNDAGEIVARYLKCVYGIMTHQNNLGKTVALLSRTNRIYHLSDLSAFSRKLKSCFTAEQVESVGGGRST